MVWSFLLFLIFLQITFIGTAILLENRDPGKTIAWLCILFFLPILGSIIYWLFGRKTQGRLFRNKHIPENQLAKMVHRQQSGFQPETSEALVLQQRTESEQKMVRLLLNSGFAPLTIYNKIEILLNGGEKFRELFNALESANHHIHLSYYIFKDDEIGADVLKILTRKAAAGVEVRVLLDGMGCLPIAGGFVRSMRQAGIQVEWFFPIRFPFLTSKLNMRYHRKIVVVDGQVGFIGGLNIGDEYLSRDAKLGFWRDTHLKLEGEAVHTLQTIFLNDWFFVTNQVIQGTPYYPRIYIQQTLPVQIGASGPDSNWAAILQGFFWAIAMAQNSVDIETPYFIPDESLIMALKTAALSGIDVRLIVQGIPEHKVTYWAMRSYFEELLQAGVKIFQYMKGIHHAKTLVIDNYFAAVGSANLDSRSFYLDFEICAFVYDQALVERLRSDFEQDLNDSNELDFKTYQARSSWERLKESSARLFSPVL